MADNTSPPDPWATFRFSVIGSLLASPPQKRGELEVALDLLAEKTWRHPVHIDKPHKVGRSTLERWYYLAKDAPNPIEALTRKVRSDAGVHRSFSQILLTELELLYRAHPGWSYQLHLDNLAALAVQRPELGTVPSYNTLRRTMQSHGWYKRRKARKKETRGQMAARLRLESYEVRSFEATHVHGLWHADFHHSSLRVVDSDGVWHVPVAAGVLDDKSRRCCHLQWYLEETADNYVHTLTQALLKHGLPRELMDDNGAPMIAAETENGLKNLSIVHTHTLAYSPYQNGKQENFWASLEGRALAMLENVQPLTLALLNRATQAWVELEYNRSLHSELGMTPLAAALRGPDVSREAPDPHKLQLAFCAEETRTQRRSDGTLSLEGVRFELPDRFRTFRKVCVRYQRWDLTQAFVFDPKSKQVLARITPLDKARNASGERRLRASLPEEPEAQGITAVDPIPPLLQKLMSEYAATGLPPAYLPKDEHNE